MDESTFRIIRRTLPERLEYLSEKLLDNSKDYRTEVAVALKTMAIELEGEES